MSHSKTHNKVIKTGNSLAVVVPAKFVNRAGIKAGDNVKVTIKLDQGRVVYDFINIRQLSLV
jgi:antitoxin component of MazEF toxin-antitoxin module